MSEPEIDLRKTLLAGHCDKDAPRQQRVTVYESHLMNLNQLDENFQAQSLTLENKIKTLESDHVTEKRGRKAAIKKALEELRKQLEQKHIEDDEAFEATISQVRLQLTEETETYKTERNIIQQNMEAARISAVKEMYEQSLADYERISSPSEKQHESIDTLEYILARLSRVIEIAEKSDEHYDDAVNLKKSIQPILAERLKQISNKYL